MPENDWSHGFLPANGIRIHAVTAGEGPTILMLHGFPENWYSWHHQIPALAGAGFRTVAVDLRGYNEIHHIPDCSHWVHQEQPEKVNELLLDFLKRRNLEVL